MTLFSLLLIIFGSFFMSCLPYVMTGSGTFTGDWDYSHFNKWKIECKYITYKRYWCFSWGMIIAGTVIQVFTNV